MKFTSSILSALSVVSVATAFQPVSVPKAATTTELFSTPGDYYGESGLVPAGYSSSREGMRLEASTLATAAGASGIGLPLQEIWQQMTPVMIQGNALKTWTIVTPTVDMVQLMMKTEGRPLNANIELWQGPDNTPCKMKVYVEDGDMRPLNVMIPTPRDQNAIAIYNTGSIEYPIEAAMEADVPGMSSPMLLDVTQRLEEKSQTKAKMVQGGAINTVPLDSDVQSVAILLKTDGRPLNCRLELMQGPNNNKQVMEVYTEDGWERPFFAIVELPGVGNVIRVINTGTIEFPISCTTEPYIISPETMYGSVDMAPEDHFDLD